MDSSFFADNIINGIFLFGFLTLLLTASYLAGIEEIDDFDDWKGPQLWLPSHKDEQAAKNRD